jgi:hypothetical protein
MVAGMAETGQRCDEPLHREERRTFHPGHFGRARPRGDHPLQMERLPFDGQDVTQESRTLSERVAV